jgi:hypothetical protein
VRLIEALLAEDELVHDQGQQRATVWPLLASHALRSARIELQTLYAWGLLQLGALAEAEALTLTGCPGRATTRWVCSWPDAARAGAVRYRAARVAGGYGCARAGDRALRADTLSLRRGEGIAVSMASSGWPLVSRCARASSSSRRSRSVIGLASACVV